MDCDICWAEYRNYEIIRMGCCNFNICKECIEHYAKCPNCKRDYFFTSKLEEIKKINKVQDEIYQKEILNLNIIIQGDKVIYKHKINDLSTEIKFMKNDIDTKNRQNIELQKYLNINTEYINSLYNREKNKKDIKNVIDKFHLF